MKYFRKNNFSFTPVSERPREKLEISGISKLSDIELLSLLLGSGSREKNVVQLASELLIVLDNSKNIPDISEFKKIKGIGSAKASAVAAALEFSRRRIRPSLKHISKPSDVLPMINYWSNLPQEHFLVLSLNGAHEVIKLRVVSKGILNKTIVHPREVFADPISDRAAAIICAHNHPSGNLTPSQDDINLTKRLIESGELLGIPLLDHVVFSSGGYISMLEEGIIN